MPDELEVYLGGGAVRDGLLGVLDGVGVGDRDWVVVGSTAEAMLALGYTPVGKDFPVFLHPQTHEEYALARTERKQGRGHRGFAVHADPTVTLEEDLLRRDLTINAIAQDAQGNIIDDGSANAGEEEQTLYYKVVAVDQFGTVVTGIDGTSVDVVFTPDTADLTDDYIPSATTVNIGDVFSAELVDGM